MATFSDLGTIASDGNFQNRVRYAMTVAAVNVYSELANTMGHPARVAFALKVIAGAFSIANACLTILTNSTIAAEANIATTAGGGYAIPDADIQFAVNSLWNHFSGA